MKRKTKLLLALSDKLCRLIDEGVEISFEQRPFLEDRSAKPVILDTPELREKERQNKEDKRIVIDQIQELLKPEPIKGTQEPIWGDS